MQPRPELKSIALECKGFLSEIEGTTLFELAVSASRLGPCLEIGSYCGKSTLFIGEGCRVGGAHPLFSVDHHRGSEEQQPGQPFFDPDLYDETRGAFTTLSQFTANIAAAELQDWIVPVVSESVKLSKHLSCLRLGLLFIDGGHSEADAFADFKGWSPLVVPSGYLCAHDVFSDPQQGGQGPYHMLEYARAQPRWRFIRQVESLGILQRV